MRRRILSIITALALCLGLCPPIALAAGTEVSVGTAQELFDLIGRVNENDTITITLTNDIDIRKVHQNTWLNITKGNITLDLGGHTLSGSGVQTIAVGNATCTVKNGTVKWNGSGPGAIYCNGTVTVEKSATVISEGNYPGLRNCGTAHIHGKISGSKVGLSLGNSTTTLYHGAVITGGYDTINYDVGTSPTVNLDNGAKAYLNGTVCSNLLSVLSGTLIICSNHIPGDWNENGERTCPNCGNTEKKPPNVAKVEKVGAETKYVTKLSEAFTGDNDGATVTLLENVRQTGMVSIFLGNFTLNLNGKSLTNTSQAAVEVEGGHSLTIEGDGAIISEGTYAINVGNGELTVNGGTIRTNSDRYPAIIVSKSEEAEPKVTINGGTIIGGVYNNEGTVKLRGGTFMGAGPGGECLSDSTSVRNLLGSEGDRYYAYFDTDGEPLPEYKTDGKSLYGTVVVKECTTHYWAYRINESTHQQYCTACGKLFDTEPVAHSPADGTCTACGYMAKPVSVVVDGGDAEITTLQDAWKLAIAEGAKESTITLLGDVHEDSIIQADGRSRWLP